MSRDAQRKSEDPILPFEFFPNESKWIATGERQALKVSSSLQESSNRPSGSVILISTEDNPVQSLSEVLLKITNASCYVDLRLLDSFWHWDVPKFDSQRLDAFIAAGYGLGLSELFSSRDLPICS